MFTVKDEVHNTGTAPVTLLPYGLVSRTGTPQVAGYYILYEGPIGYLDGTLQEVKYASLTREQPIDYDSTGGWLGFTDKYWLTALIPPQKEAVKARFRHTQRERGRPLSGRLSRRRDHAWRPAPRLRSPTRFFAGAKEVDLLDAYEPPPAFRASTAPSISAGSISSPSRSS